MGSMTKHDWMAERFEANRTHLRAVAYRMLGSQAEADDAVQETWIAPAVRTRATSKTSVGG
jgi:RNA polymerase sigma-70 factor (ECF subfamily)